MILYNEHFLFNPVYLALKSQVFKLNYTNYYLECITMKSKVKFCLQFTKGLNMIFVPVKKSLKNIPANFFLFEKGPWPHIFDDIAWVSYPNFWPKTPLTHVV